MGMGIGGMNPGMVVGSRPGFIVGAIGCIIWNGGIPKKFGCIIIGCGNGRFIGGGGCCNCDRPFFMVLLNCYRYCLDM
jgi:hypothetical protein